MLFENEEHERSSCRTQSPPTTKKYSSVCPSKRCTVTATTMAQQRSKEPSDETRLDEVIYEREGLQERIIHRKSTCSCQTETSHPTAKMFWIDLPFLGMMYGDYSNSVLHRLGFGHCVLDGRGWPSLHNIFHLRTLFRCWLACSSDRMMCCIL